MKNRQVGDLMAKASEYAVIEENKTLPEAAIFLKKSFEYYMEKNIYHDSILVCNKEGKLKGKVSAFDIIRVLEPNYSKVGDSDSMARFGVSHFGLSPDYVKSIVSRYELWDESLEIMVKNASFLKVEDFMYTPEEGGFVEEDSAFADAIHQIVMGHQTSVLVLNQGEITGVIRLGDIFREVCSCL